MRLCPVFVLLCLLATGCVRMDIAEAPAPTASPGNVTSSPRPPQIGAPDDASPAAASAEADDRAEPTDTRLAPPVTPLPGALGPEFPDDVNPLTGLPVNDPAVLDRRPIVAKISNAPPLVRPQAGIGSADLVFEHYAEGGLTRFSAVFYSQLPDRVGSVRSARLIDYELVPMYNALLVYSGASNGVNAIIGGSEFFERTYMGIQYGPPYYTRDESIEVPHNLFANLRAVSALAEEEGLNDRPRLRGMTFHPQEPDGQVSDASVIDIRYIGTRVRWEWDEANDRYRRSADGLPHYDANLNQQLTAENIVVLFAEHRFTDIVESEWQGSVSYSIEIKLWFEGDAVLFRDGERYDVRWWRPTREDMIRLVTPEGQPVYLKPGRTWFQVMRPPDQQDPAEEGLTVE